jgi:thiol:disulfide interchange protein DsbG
MRRALATILLATGTLICGGMASHGWAASPADPSNGVPAVQDPLNSRGRELPAIFKTFESQGMTLTALGEHAGVWGYLLQSPDNKRQAVYLMPDGKTIVVGPMYSLIDKDKSLENITGLQIEDMKRRFEAKRAQIAELQRQADAARKTADEEAKAAEVGKQQADDAARQFSGTSVGGIQPPVAPVGATDTSSQSVAPPVSQPDPSLVYVSSMDKDRFLLDWSRQAWFPVGHKANSVPTVFMIADPRCPHCHKAWEKLSDMVTSGKIIVDVLVVSVLQNSADDAISLLAREQPGQAWYLGEGSKDGNPVVAGPNPENPAERNKYMQARSILQANMNFMHHMADLGSPVNGTPWLAYVGKDGRLRAMEGDQNIDKFLANL